MSKKISSSTEDIIMRADILAALISNFEREIKQIAESGPVAPPDSWILRYQVKGKSDTYWYYKLQCKEAVFPEQGDSSKFSKYKHLGKPGSTAYNEAIICLARRVKIDALERMINTIKQGWLDLYEEKEKNERRKSSRNKNAN